MAKRYTKFENLVQGTFKPSGTIGKHFATVVTQGDNLVVIGSREGRVTLRPGDTLGYDCGRVWVLPKPESYKDPVRRFLATEKFSQKLLTSEMTILGEGERPLWMFPEPIPAYPTKYWKGWGCFLPDDLTKISVAVRYTDMKVGPNEYRRYVSAVYVSPTANREEAVTWLSDELTSAGYLRRKEVAKRLSDEDDRQEAEGKRLLEELKQKGIAAKCDLFPESKDWFEFEGSRFFLTDNGSVVYGFEVKDERAERWNNCSTHYGCKDYIAPKYAYRYGLLQAWLAAIEAA